MKTIFNLLIVAIIGFIGTNAYAGGNENGCSNQHSDECKHYTPQPTPTPSGSPISIDNKPVVNASANADANAKANAIGMGVGGGATLKSTISGTNTGTFTNDGRQSTSIGPVSSSSTGGIVKDVGNGNGSGNTTTASATGNGAGNSTTFSDNSSTTYKHIEVPVMFNPVPPSTTSTSLMTKETFTCGPLQQVVRTAVSGTQVGSFSNTSIDLGYDYELAPIVDKDGNQVFYKEKIFEEGGVRVVRHFGSQASIVTALPNVSGANSFSLGFAGTNGGGSGGGGSSSAMQRIVTKITVADCELPGAYRLIEVPVSTGPSAEDVLRALAKAKILLNMPTTTIVNDQVPCKMEQITRADGTKETRCLGPKSGSYRTTRVVSGNAPVTGSIELGVTSKK
jgi:hypothetical protein